MTDSTTVPPPPVSPPLPPNWEASLAKLAKSAPDLGTLHDVNIGKLLVLVGIYEQVAAIAQELKKNPPIHFERGAVDDLSIALSKVNTADADRRFAEVRQTLEGSFAAGFAKTSDAIETLKAAQFRSDELAAAFRIEVLERHRSMASDIDRLGLRTSLVADESEALGEAVQERQAVVEAAVAQLVVDAEEVPPGRRGRESSGRAGKRR